MLQIQQQKPMNGMSEWMADKKPTISPPRSAGFSLLFITSQLRDSGWRKPEKPKILDGFKMPCITNKARADCQQN
jgi:hypothetical protein